MLQNQLSVNFVRGHVSWREVILNQESLKSQVFAALIHFGQLPWSATRGTGLYAMQRVSALQMHGFDLKQRHKPWLQNDEP